jgi:hypothetical protein
MFRAAAHRKQWDDTVASVANRETSPTAQFPKRFGPIYATAPRGSRSARRVMFDDAEFARIEQLPLM